MKKEYVCVSSDNKNIVGVVFQFKETEMIQNLSQPWGTKTYRYKNGCIVYAEKKDVTYMVTNGQEYRVLDSRGYPYYKGGFQPCWNVPKWGREEEYKVCAEYRPDFKFGDIVKLRSKEETRLEVVESITCNTIYPHFCRSRL